MKSDFILPHGHKKQYYITLIIGHFMKKYNSIILAALFAVAFFGVAANTHAAVKPADYGLQEGDLISAVFSDDPDVYIINNQGYKRLFLNPEIFGFYQHLGGFFNVKLVSTEVRDAFITSGLFRNCEDNDSKIYGVDIEGEDSGKLHWVNVSAGSATSEDPAFFDKVFCVNKKEFSWYPKGAEFKKVNDVPKYERMKEKATVTTKEKIKKFEDEDDEDERESKDHGKDRDENKRFEKRIKNIGKVVLCHKQNETITISWSALRAHLAHGDEVGKCGSAAPDTTAPVVSGITAGSVTNSGALIAWTTNESANSKVWYGSVSPVVATSSTLVVSNASFVATHSLALSSLSASTTYYYMVESADAAGNKTTSAQQSFTTVAAPDTTAPSITALLSANIATSSATITWTTNESANSKVWYGSVSPVVATASTSAVSDTSFAATHSIVLAGLVPNTTYYYLVESADASGNKSVSAQQSFATLALPDTTAPVISATSTASLATDSVHILWTTDEAADSTIWFSAVTPVVVASASTVTSATLVTSHDVALSGLTASTTYYYLIGSKDAVLNAATTAEQTFTTLAL